jgi:hypothetical protein
LKKILKSKKKIGVRPLAPLSFTKKGFFEGGASGLTPFFFFKTLNSFFTAYSKQL